MGQNEVKKGVSLKNLNAVEASSKTFAFQYIHPDGSDSGITFHVYGGQSEKVTKAAAEMINEARRKAAAREINRSIGSRASRKVDFDPIENDVEFGQKLSAIRIANWEGIDEPCTPENALLLCQTNRDIAATVMEYSDNIANFMKL